MLRQFIKNRTPLPEEQAQAFREYARRQGENIPDDAKVIMTSPVTQNLLSNIMGGGIVGAGTGALATPLIRALKPYKTANFNNGNSNMNTQIKLAIAQRYLEKRAFQEKVAQAIVKFQKLPPIIKQALFSDEVMQRLSAGDPSMIKAAAKSSLVMHTNQGQIPLTKIAAACTSVAKGKKAKVKEEDKASFIGQQVMDSVKSGGTLFSLPKNMSKYVNKATGARSIQQAVPKSMQKSYSPNYVAPPKPPVTQGNPGARRTTMQIGGELGRANPRFVNQLSGLLDNYRQN